MEDLKQIVAQNITDLRKKQNMTQAELAEKLNYSDKAVSKWERGESLPDIAVLKEIAVIFSVKVDYLLTEEHADPSLEIPRISRHRVRNQRLITAMCIVLVWLIATFIFVNIQLVIPDLTSHWLIFVYAIPVTCIVWLVFNSIWFKPVNNFLIISFLLWSTLVSVYLSMLCYLDRNAWLLFVIGIPGQILVILWSGIRHPKKE